MSTTCRNAHARRALSLGIALGAVPLLACSNALASDAPRAAEEPGARVIELAICLDTSGSMNGLIEAAKQKLWAIVNELALAEPTPRLRVALLTFGNDGHDAEAGWVAVQTPFTEDLDLVSQRLFVLTTNGGTELVGRVLNGAGELQWHPSDDALKLVVVAGNESADQDQVMPYTDVCKKLITRGIMVNSIYCGPAEDDIAPGWKQVALLADGQFASIDQNEGTVVIETPFDVELGALSSALNTTYLPFGASGLQGWTNQVEQDENAAGLNAAAAAQRCTTKGSEIYSCSWDLVDASSDESFDLLAVKADELPEHMRDMTGDERKAHVAEMAGKRAGIRKQIVTATAKREAFVRDEMKKRSLDDSRSFDGVLRRTIRAQATAKGFTFKEAKVSVPEAEVEAEKKG